MDIHKSMNNWKLISIKHGYPFMDIYCLLISIAECPCMGIRAWISMWISTLVWIIEDWHPKIMDPCWYPWIFGNPCMDLLWILGPGSRWYFRMTLGDVRKIDIVVFLSLLWRPFVWLGSHFGHGFMNYVVEKCIQRVREALVVREYRSRTS